ncbi:MAG: FkbM family methyltransferase [Clostridia bacterium]|nr:FkbM family methyltransferase [Clostridia bacterium]
MQLPIRQDLWSYLKGTEKPIVMYGMGNGADKILAALDERGIAVDDFFASDGFVRGHAFHGKTVLSYSDVKEKYGAGNFIVLLSFASALPDVIERIEGIAAETELYAPDIPVVLSEDITDAEVFDLNYFKAHEKELDAVSALFSDERSRELLRDVISYRLTGSIRYLLDRVDDRDTVYRSLLSPEKYIRCADLGAYNGDTVRELLPFAPNVEEIYCIEPDPRNFKKLSAYAENETRCRVIPLNFAAHDKRETLMFETSGNRNATLGSGNPAAKKHRAVECDSLSHLLDGYGSPKIDYIKFDVEGSEKAAIDGCLPIIRRDRPTLLVSLYHRREDIFALPLRLASLLDGYDFYLRRFRYIPAWDLNLYAIPKNK